MLWWLAQTTVTVAVLAAIIVVVSRVFRLSPAVRHALWLLVLLKLITPPLIGWEVPFLNWRSESHSSMRPPEIDRPHPAETRAPNLDVAATPALQSAGDPSAAPKSNPSKAVQPFGHDQQLPEGTTCWNAETIGRRLSYVWMIGVALAAVLVLIRIARFRRILAWRLPATAWLKQQVYDLARLIQVRAPQTQLVPGIRSPFVWCVGLPKLFLPEALMNQLCVDGRRTVIAHELAHLRRRDHWVRWLELIAFLIWWWNPLFWLVRRGLRDNAELACDAWVVTTMPAARRAYAEALIEVSRCTSLTIGLAPALGMAGRGRNSFEGRLTMIMRDGVKCRVSAGSAILIGIVALLVLPSWSPAQKDEPKRKDQPALTKENAGETALAVTLKRAQCNGKYSMLLRLFHQPGDAETYTEFRDFGMYKGTSYAGHDDLPPGYWVYAEPNWYIWRDVATARKIPRNWGPEQATGAPDTDEAGDRPTAWASRTPDEQDEWLLLEYAEVVMPKEVQVHATFNPGAIHRLTGFRLDGTEVELWKGQDPTATDSDKGVSTFTIKDGFLTNRIKIYLASKDAPGWNEIDAVGLVNLDGKTQWATAAEASSTFAQTQKPQLLMTGRPVASTKRAWGPEQVTGPPDTTGAGDYQSAWASLTEDTQDEWLQLDYAVEILPVAVQVHANYNPGAIYKITVLQVDGAEVEVWKGKDPTRPGSGSGVSVIPIQVDFKTKRVKIYLASKDTPGWNEIDAVGLRDEAGKVHWATAATASSTYAQQTRDFDRNGLVLFEKQVEMERLMALEMENRALKKQVAELKGASTKDNSDSEFIRRLYVDLTGKPATAAEVESFVNDTAANKRVRLVEKIVLAMKTDK